MYKDYLKSSSKIYFNNEAYEGEDFESTPYMYFDSFFSEDECDIINALAEKEHKQLGVTFGGLSPDLRNSEISWFSDNQETGWIYDRIMDSTFKSNIWNFDVYGIKDGLQYTRYKGTQEEPAFYGWHKDTGPKTQHRKISFVALLTDPADFSGGEVQLKTVNKDNLLTKKGSAIIFPSFIHHQVKPVTQGERVSLVAWVSGPKLR